MKQKNITKVDLRKLDATRDKSIDYGEIPELDDEFFAHAERIHGSKSPAKTAFSVRVDDAILRAAMTGTSGVTRKDSRSKAPRKTARTSTHRDDKPLSALKRKVAKRKAG